MNIGFDIDGVLFPWDDVARDALVERFGIERPGPSTYWTFLQDELPNELWRWLWREEGQRDVFGRIHRTYPDAIRAVNALLKRGHRVHFVTHRDPRYTAINTARFLAGHLGAHPWAGVHVVQNHVQKRRLAEWDVFVDDKPDTVFDFLDGSWTTKVFAPVRLWNVDELADLNYAQLVHYTDPWAIVEWVEARS